MTKERTEDLIEERASAARLGLRRFPPVQSPLSAKALWNAAVRSPGRADTIGQLRRLLCAEYAASDCVLFDSGTQALRTAIAQHARREGEPALIALPAYSCYDVPTAAIGAGARIVLYDIDPDTLGPDWDSFDAALSRGASSAVVAPLFGLPVDWQSASSIAARHGAALIEDAAQGAGATWHGARVGSLGRMSVLSFGRGKGWTGGGGGALLYRDEILPAASPPAPSLHAELRVVVMSAAQMMLSNPHLFALPASLPWLHLGETVFKRLGDARGISRYSAGLLLATWSAARDEDRRRKLEAERLLEAVSSVPGLTTITHSPASSPGYLRVPVRAVPTMRARMLTELRGYGLSGGYPQTIAKLVEARDHIINVHDSFAGAETLVQELVTLPSYGAASALLSARLRLFRKSSR